MIKGEAKRRLSTVYPLAHHPPREASTMGKRAKRKSGQTFHYRCPSCHHIIEEERLLGEGCPMCGWVSPLRKGDFADQRTSVGEREPLIDIFDGKDWMRVVAELPGVDEEDIKLNIENHALTISIPNHRYYREVDLPCSVSDDVITTYMNGILEIKLKK
ncbi:MAG: hypothetical protein QMC77_07935 [Methanocellales archaeon]|nr:hypothetical protein [Methanocellales archaeon]